ncbi:MAG: CHAT domain-containing protein [Dokdonella sp.]
MSDTSGVAIESSADRPLFLEVRETGALLTATSVDLVSVSTIPVPYRYGIHRVELAPGQVLNLRPAAARSSLASSATTIRAEIIVTCGTGPVDAQRRDWLDQVAATTKPLTTFLSPTQSADLQRAIDRLAASATGPADVALATHVRAQILLLGNRHADSVDAFADAAERWQAAGDPARARVALVGEVEDLQRLARHDDALAVVDKAAATLPRHDYFAARLRLSRCLTLRYLARMNEALACFRTGSAAMQQLGEIPDLVSALQDMADVSRYLADNETARLVGTRALRLAVLPQMELQRGRIHLMLGDIALEQGDMATAVVEQDLALTEFVASKSPRWEANAQLRSAELYLALGAFPEASDLVSAALSKLSERDAPARVAAAQVVRADIDIRLNRIDSARDGLARAVATYRRLAMPIDLDSAQLIQAQLELRSRTLPAVAALLAKRDRKQKINAVDWRLIEARLLAAQDDCAKAEQALLQLDSTRFSIQNELDRVQVRAGCQADKGDAAGAQASLLATAQRIAALARAVDNPLLRQMLVGYITPLRQQAFAIAFTSAATAMDAAMAWHWLRLDDVTAARGGTERSSTAATQFDSEVAAELLASRKNKGPAKSGRDVADRSASAAGPRRLLAVLASDMTGASPANAIAGATSVQSSVSLKTLQQRLGDAVYLSYVDAGEHSQLFWISRDAVRLVPTLNAIRLREATDQLLKQVGDAGTPMQTIASSAGALSKQLLTPDDAQSPPAILLIDAASPLAALPWSVLQWSDAQSLLDTTRVSMVRVDDEPRSERSNPSNVAPSVNVFVAGQSGSAEFGTLLNASAEPGLIASAIAASGGTMQRLTANDRASLLDAFAQPSPWLHVAAHGDARASRVGYAGIWLDAEAHHAPQFVSWLEILSRGSHNQLVVLNACDLAGTESSSSAGLSFADAVSRAGARDVVAARWQVSDAATALWVPAFYQAIGADRHAAAALASAQKRLRDSRMFRHPFYWAAYVHLGQL